MKKTILLILLGVCRMFLSGSAQSYFNSRSTNNSYFNYYSSVIESGSKYYCTGGAFDSSIILQTTNPYYNPGLAFSVIGKDGVTLIRMFFQLPYKAIGAWSNALRRLPDGSFLVAAYTIDTANIFRQLVVDYDSTGQVLWHKEISKTSCGGNANEFWRLEDFQPTGTGEWLLLGTVSCHQYNNETDYSLMKLDSSFNVIWEKIYGDATKNNTGGKLLIDGNSYIMAGGMDTYNVLPHATTYQAELFRLDTAGNIITHNLIANAKRTDAIKDIIKTQDGGYIYCGNGAGYELTPQQFFTDIAWKGWVQKLDANFNPVWADTFSTFASNTGLVQLVRLIEHPDGSIMVGGEVTEGYTPTSTSARNYGALIKLRPDGSVVWQKKYAVPNDTLEHKIYDMKQTSDGGYILCGEAKDGLYPYTYPLQQAWLIKVDSNGCMSGSDPQCWPVAVPHHPLITSSEYKVYPNPVSDVLLVRYTNAGANGAVIQLMDVLGRVIITSAMEGKTGNINIDVRGLQSGVYLYRIMDGGVITKQGRFLKR